MSRLSTFSVLGLLFGLAVLGVSLLIWLAPVSAEEMTPAQDSLINIADWMTKASVGALLGFAGGRLAGGRSNGRPS